VVVKTYGKALERLRGEAYCVARDAKTDWYVEPRDIGRAFCFENADPRDRFCTICEKESVAYASKDLDRII